MHRLDNSADVGLIFRHLSSFDLREYPTYESRSFIAPFAIKSMSTSSSRLGVTTKSLLGLLPYISSVFFGHSSGARRLTSLYVVFLS